MLLYIFINMILMMDTGLFSSASAKIKETLKVNDQLFGLFGSCNHSGRILGTIIFMFIFIVFNRKYLLFIYSKSIKWFRCNFWIYIFSYLDRSIWNSIKKNNDDVTY